MGQCSCGKTIDEAEGQCARCHALGDLELTSEASAVQIEEAYRRLVEEWQPRRSSENPKERKAAEDKITALKAAHSWLSAEENAEPALETELTPSNQNGNEAELSVEQPSEQGSVRRHPQMRQGLTFLLLCGTIVAGFITIDTVLSLVPATAPAYATFKTNSWNAFMARMSGMKNSQGNHSASESDPSNLAGAEPAAESRTASNRPRRGASHPGAEELARELANVPLAKNGSAYVTLGFKPREVAAVLGPPSSVSLNALTYGSSVIYLHNGIVSGWKVDPAAHLPVRLWPTHQVDPALDTFTTGSTKDQVISVQGTPTLLTNDKFGYGNSEVFFQGGHVAGWLNNPGSVPLKVHEE